MDYCNLLTNSTLKMKNSMIRELVATTKNIPDLISFAGGFPAPATFPKQILSELYLDVVNQDGYEVLQYGASEGDRILKQALIKWEGFPDMTADKMLITVGATNGIYLYSRVLSEEGDVILCEAPTFVGSVVSFEATGAELIGIPVLADGIDLEKLQSKVSALRKQGRKIKFLYLIPDFQNPSGVTMSLKRRKEVLTYCIREQIPILEDNPYSRLRLSGKTLPTLYSLTKTDFGGSDIVTEIVSFSKILGPGMRMAFAKGSPQIISKMESWQQKVNVCPDSVTQRVTAAFLDKGFMPQHLQAVCNYYKPYLNKMLSCLERDMPDYVKWTKPDGGIFIWLWLPESMNADEIFEKARAHRVSFIPGSKFYPEGQEKYNCLRLNYTYSTEQQIETGISRLAGIMRKLKP